MFSESFDKQDEDDQVLDEIDFYDNLNIFRHLISDIISGIWYW